MADVDAGRRAFFGFTRATGGSKDGGPHCAFCGKSKTAARKLIEGPSAVICDACVEVCNDILAGDAAAATHTPAVDPYSDAPVDEPLRCLICGGQIPPADVITIPARGALCAACAGPVRAAIARATGR